MNTLTRWNGVALAALVGICFATNSSLAGVAYVEGSNPLSVLFVRAVAAFIALNLLLRDRRVPRRLPPTRRFAAIGLGVIFAGYSYGIMAAIQMMPVALVILSFYTYPLMVACWAWWRKTEVFSARTALALGFAFVGLMLALNVFSATPNLLGTGLSIGSALLLTIVLSLTPLVRGDGDSRPVTLHMLGTAATCFALGLVVDGEFSFPHSAYGWFGFIGAPVFYTFGIIKLFEVLGRIGPVRMSLVMNIEPVASVVLGYVLLQQSLSVLQLFGVALVIGSLVLVEVVKLARR